MAASSKHPDAPTPAAVERIAYRPAEFAQAVGLPVSSIRSWLDEYVSSKGRSGLPHTRPMPHTILIWVADLPRWRSRYDALKVSGKSVSPAKISDPGNLDTATPDRPAVAGDESTGDGDQAAAVSAPR